MILYRTRALTMVTKPRTRVVAAAYFNIAILRGALGGAEKKRAVAVAAVHCSSRVL